MKNRSLCKVWVELALDRPVKAIIGEDNAATIKAIKKGYSPALRHLQRQQRCSLGQLHDSITNEPLEGVGALELVNEPTNTHNGDTFTKA